MYIFDKVINQYFFFGKVNNQLWEYLNDLELTIIDSQEELESVYSFLLEDISSEVFHEMKNETEILIHPTYNQIYEIFKKPINNLIFGEGFFGELINDLLMVQVIKETLVITLLHSLKDGNKRLSWFFFLYSIRYLYLIDGDEYFTSLNKNDGIRKYSILSEMNEFILQISQIGNKAKPMNIAREVFADFQKRIFKLLKQNGGKIEN